MITHEELMRYLDGELPADRAREVETALEQSTELRRELAVFQRMKTDLASMGAEMKPRRTVWEGVRRRLAKPMGWTLFLAGAAVWVVYGVYAYLTGGEALWEKLATSAVVIGLLILLATALLDRWTDLRTDPYREIER